MCTERTIHENILSFENWVFLLLLGLDTIGAETDGSMPLQINKTPLKYTVLSGNS